MLWGRDAPTYTDILNGCHQLKIRKILYTALRCLRKLDVMLTLWVDALCIDQSNVRERSAQVGKMGHIFKKATSVLVWIGKPKQDADAIDIASRVFHSQSYSSSGAAIENAIGTSVPRWSTMGGPRELYWPLRLYSASVRSGCRTGKSILWILRCRLNYQMFEHCMRLRPT